MFRCKALLPGCLLFVAPMFGQASDQLSPGGLILVPSEPMSNLTRQLEERAQPKPAEPRDRQLRIQPSGNARYYVEEREWDGNQWRTYQIPKVDPFSQNADGVAIQGYDVISYLDRRPEKGSETYAASYGGVVWWFTTEEHLRTFVQDPERFLPEYGGFCAYSVGQRNIATADPRAYAIEGGRLYLFFDFAAKTVWEQDRATLVNRADANWPKLHR